MSKDPQKIEKRTAASYSLKIRIIHHYLVVSSPEWGIQISAGTLHSDVPQEKRVTAQSIGQTALRVFGEIQNKIDESENRGIALPTAREESEVPLGSRDKFLSIREASLFLGVSQGTVRRLVARQVLKTHHTPGGHRRFASQDLEQFLENQAKTRGAVPGYRIFERLLAKEI